MKSSRTSKRHVGQKLAIGMVTAGVLSVGLAVPAHAIGNDITGLPAFVNLANQGAVVFSGTADPGVTEVTLAIHDEIDQSGLTVDIMDTVTLPGTNAEQAWSSAPLDLSALLDGDLTIFSSYDGNTPTSGIDPTVVKDTDAPESPTVLPESPATFAAPTEIFIESLGDQERTHFTFGSAPADPTQTPDSLVPTPPLASHTVSNTQQVRAIAWDLAGNPSLPMVADFTVTVIAPPPPPPPPPPGGGNPPPIVVTPPVAPAVLVAPRVTVRAPASVATGVSRVNNVTAKFNMAVTGVNARSFTLRTRAGTAVPAVVTYNKSSRMAVLNPTRTLAPDTTYVATLSTAIKAGKALPLTRWSFVTGARPAVAAHTPGSNASRVSRTANLTTRFTENVLGVSRSSVTLVAPNGTRIAAVVSYNRITRTATLNPSSRLAARTRYTLRLSSAIKDAAGNPLTAIRWSFTTA